VPVGASSAAVDHSTLPRVTLGHVDAQSALRHPSAAGQASALLATVKLKTFTASVVDNAHSYKYTIVGKNPAIATLNPSTTITTFIVPLNIIFTGFGNWDPTVADSCDAGASALVRTQKSPIVNNHAYTWGGTAIGSAQYVDAFQRAQFWAYANPSGINPGYHVKLKVSTLPTVNVDVPLTNAAFISTSCGNDAVGAVEIGWLDGYLQSTVIPALASSGVGPNTFPIFLVHNVIEYIGTTATCCALGYHNAYKPSLTSSMQTYAVADYDNSGIIVPGDVTVLAHEVGEWMNDPYTNNPTRAWGHIGQVSGCQSNLEVGDPLSGTSMTVSMNLFKYHPQELAFFSWFYRQSPSLGVNGWYSNKGTFTTTQGTCA
jgi:hypothetical protein